MKSVWSESYNIKKRRVLEKDIEIEVAVVGGGIAGLLTAYLLKEKGKKVVVIDRREILQGNTLNTTAKITFQHDLIYDKLIKEYKKEGAQQYLKANQAAIEKYKKIISENNVDCDFEERDAYVYTFDEVVQMENEYEAAMQLGIEAELVNEIELPFKVAKALKFKKQNQFNPIKFLNFIAKDLKIYENTKAIDITSGVVTTDKGKIKAKHIVVATHFPIINTPGYYFLRMHQDRSYVVAFENAQNIKGMYIDENKNGYSFRSYNDLLLVGGSSKRTGSNEEGGSYDNIIEFTKKFYPDATPKYRWSAQDCMTSDGIPFIGEYSNDMKDVYVATGFNKWGMTSSMVAALIITDKITKTFNDYCDIFSPNRYDVTASIKNTLKDVGYTAYNFIAQRVRIPTEAAEDIREGCGGIVTYNGETVGVYKDEKGEIYAVSTKCPHLGCELKWDADELSWDCPCHGSRFDYKGNLLNSPAIKELKYEEEIQ